jgi:hypothetical protein
MVKTVQGDWLHLKEKGPGKQTVTEAHADAVRVASVRSEKQITWPPRSTDLTLRHTLPLPTT